MGKGGIGGQIKVKLGRDEGCIGVYVKGCFRGCELRVDSTRRFFATHALVMHV